ncbi:ribonuclease H-like domain-containing protein [Cohnella kolymensis]|uniref:ribonuclease H-like domain-containing protein n=1 Tax=Cohnella kolymensis TaxID=1590652 RepID=UPI000696F72E|nr:ribonuclease H-like domain-containing protein [Cohnella kolymensis]
MSGLKERLGRLRAASAAAPEAPKAAASVPDGSLHPKFASMGVELYENEYGAFLLRRMIFPFPYRHGHHDLIDLAGCAARLTPIAARQNRAADTPAPHANQLLFLDTETTGLGVGTGNVPFMIGFGYCTEHTFVVEQTLIRHPGEEKAMLAYLLSHLKDKTHLVTYNGRTFDWPVLVNRFILNGWRRSGPEPGHLDFLHPSRALWKNTLPSCRLGTVEESRLGIRRGHDVPGSMAPVLYVQYLNDGNPEHLHGVYVHNEKDVLTLASLAVHFGQLLDGNSGDAWLSEAPAEELFRTACWLEQHGSAEHAERLFEQLAVREDFGDGGWAFALAARYKRAGRHDRALPLWKQTAKQPKPPHCRSSTRMWSWRCITSIARGS